MKKKYFKTKSYCRVTFRLPKSAVTGAKSVHLVGEFNRWKKKMTPLKKLKNGCFTVDLDLPVGNEYQFRYLIDQTRWENDHDADRYVKTPYGDADNSVVIT